MLLTITISRRPSTDQGTFGRLCVTDPRGNVLFQSFVTELPWKNNQSQMSCIPVGEYMVKRYQSPKFGNVFMVADVPDRKYILFHSGNYAGDTSKGWRTHSHGCILPAMKLGVMNGQFAGLASLIARQFLFNILSDNDCKLIIL